MILTICALCRMIQPTLWRLHRQLERTNKQKYEKNVHTYQQFNFLMVLRSDCFERAITISSVRRLIVPAWRIRCGLSAVRCGGYRVITIAWNKLCSEFNALYCWATIRMAKCNLNSYDNNAVRLVFICIIICVSPTLCASAHSSHNYNDDCRQTLVMQYTLRNAHCTDIIRGSIHNAQLHKAFAVTYSPVETQAHKATAKQVWFPGIRYTSHLAERQLPQNHNVLVCLLS